MHIKKIILLSFIALILGACSPPPPGAASFTVISDQPDKTSKYYTPSGESVEGRDCFTAGPFYLFLAGKMPVEETLLSKVLEENNADVLLDAEIKHTSIFIPYIFMHSCVNVSGTPAKLRKSL